MPPWRSPTTTGAFWALQRRRRASRGRRHACGVRHFLPINAMEQYVATLSQDSRSAIGDHKLWIFGHLGDGNLHVIVQVQLKDYLALRPKIAVVYGPLGKLGGSISAEHGIGLRRKPYRSAETTTK
jgi:FAD/FMN-containing dehydrogenase